MTAPLAGVLDRAADAPAPRTLLDVLRETTAEHPDSSAIEDAVGALSYRQLMAAVVQSAARLHEAGVRRGDRVGIRMESGARELYIAILSVIAAGAAYVPVDADDPQERADLVFGEAKVVGVISGRGGFIASERLEATLDATPDAPDAATDAVPAVPLFDGATAHPSTHATPILTSPTVDDDAWIIFTSGSTGTPKGVAVTHRSAAAFVDAEARLFLQGAPLGPGDRVLAGLSVAFDASCEEMWLAWRYGACLVPAPRSLVRSGMDLGPWLVTHGITVVSTVPTLAALWPVESLENVRLLIFGGEACPPELAERLASAEREVWNTYGPTEATVVACAALLDGSVPVRIGLPLDGWALAVVDAAGNPVADGEVGELIIGGVGLARYLDPAKDAEKYAPLPSLGWDRAYRSGDLVQFDRAGLVFQGRADDQVKVGGRRIELGEVEAAVQALPGVTGAAVAVRRTDAGNQVLVGYIAVADRTSFDQGAARARLAEELPAAIVPLLAIVDELPTRTSGKVDKAALPWPLTTEGAADADGDSTTQWLAQHWLAVLGVPASGPDASFFDLGGGSLSAAQLVTRIRERDPEFTVADIYDYPRLGAMAAELDTRVRAQTDEGAATFRESAPTPRSTQWLQTLVGIPLFILRGVRWLIFLLSAAQILAWISDDFAFLPVVPLWMLVLGILVFVTPFGRMAIAVVGARMLLSGVEPGDYARGGSVHMRMWLADQIAHQIGAVGLAGAPWVSYYARALGAKIGPNVDLHTMPPVTGMLTIGEGAAVEPEVDLAGYWIDGDVVRIGRMRIGAHSTIGARSTLLPGARIGKYAEIAPGSAVFGRVPSGQRWAGSPAERVGPAPARRDRPEPARRTRWLWAYAAASLVLSLLPIIAFGAGGVVIAAGMRGADDLGEAALAAAAWLVPATLVTGVVFAGLVVVLVRLLAIGLNEGRHPVRSRIGWQAWSTERLLDASRTLLFPLYSSLFTPVWLRMLGAKVGRGVEASTVLLIPSMTTIDDHAFLADDTMVASYELQDGWMVVGPARIGKRAFLGNSGMAAPGHRVAKDSLVAVLSVAPAKSKAGSSWLGSPPVRLRRANVAGDETRTYNPTPGLRLARTLWELCRILPVFVTCGIGLGVFFALAVLVESTGPIVTVLLSGVVMLVAGGVAASVTTIAKWVFVGRIRVGEHPLWSSFVWRTEVSDTFVEMVAAPWFAQSAAGTPALAVWLRTLGASIGRGVWCDSYWLPEADLVRLGDGSTVNRGCVVQTHLFHDRIMSMDVVSLDAGATLGPHSVILPAARIGAHATVGPASLVMRGEEVPVGSRWSGNPIGPWRVVSTADYHVRVR
ncbi:Pls/PosA family non-ribosomal peptide synthetase [Orlajensenia leifsoniae]|uniref:Amino acid adenylation domain-containing protein n=1 Tax=Orlajensenia leifsoniae TaxID=2561933 RepID=A0A4Y9R5X8_9MICO|nr:Pls/PosA family non-ribosomal peptide synthetase [Leifsonia flava]TFV99750.1 amino acid adenylation domain-containing protein [Leifsonia flava]